MKRPGRACLALFVGIATSCGDGATNDHGVAVPAVGPFERLAGLRLPVALRDLTKARPLAQATGFGLSESGGAATINFYAQHPNANVEVPPTPKSLVDHVAAEWGEIGDDSAAAVWRTSIERLSTALGKAPECLRPRHEAVFALWRTPDSATAYVQLHHSVTGPVRQSATVSVGFMLDTTILMIARGPATPCADPYELGGSHSDG